MTTAVLLDDAVWLLLDLAAWALLAVTVVRVIRLDRHRSRHGRLSKLGWLAVTVLVTWPVGPITIPVGAIVALAWTWTGRREGPGIDLADGTRTGAQ